MAEVFYCDKGLVLCAPTGSGKTAVFELAIIRQLCESQLSLAQVKVIYMAPIKALCSERFEDWKQKFGGLGLQCRELTGDTEIDDYYELQDAHIIFTTPEKWDSMTRRWRDNTSLVRTVSLFFIDEVHMLNDNTRGATMEAVVSRMKTIQSSLQAGSSGAGDAGGITRPSIRFIAVSATVPNVTDVAEWLTIGESKAVSHKMEESLRPVRLRKVVLGYPCSDNTSQFRFDLTLNYKLAHVIDTYSEQKPTLVFCATRKSVQQGASTLVKDTKFILSLTHKQQLQTAASTINDLKLRELVLGGVGFHHAGLDSDDRRLIETIFSQGMLPVLLATSTLAMGVNLPAHLVVVKSTQHYVGGVYEEYSQSQVLQMIGRAGRPQFDTTATAVIMTKTQTKYKYDALMNGTQLIESSLHMHLTEHLNAEIVLNTIRDVSVALQWIKSTFLYIRVLSNPKHYNIPIGLTEKQVEAKLNDMMLANINSLASIRLVTLDGDGFTLQATESGRLMARYCVCFPTMRNFYNIQGTESLSEMLSLLCSSEEFNDVTLRVSEKKSLNGLNKDKNRTTVRFPLEGKIKSSAMKVNVLVQATFGCLTVQDFGLQQDVSKIFRAGLRVVRCLVEVLWQRSEFQTLLNALLLCKGFKVRLWENSRYVARQVAGIGNTLATALVNAGITTLQKLDDCNPRDIELIVNRHPPFGNAVKEAVSKLPRYELQVDQDTTYADDQAELLINITISNGDVLRGEATHSQKPVYCVLLIGDADNNIVYKTRISNVQVLREGKWTGRVRVRRAKKSDELSVNYISQDWVGVDVQGPFTPFYTGSKRIPVTMAAETPPVQQQNQQDNALPAPPLGAGRAPCNHRCTNKQLCGHDCCKQGIAKQRPGNGGKVDKFRAALKHKISLYHAEPENKRPKDLAQYSYTPKPSLQSGAYPTTPAGLPDLPPAAPLVAHTPVGAGWEEVDLHQQRCNAATEWNNIGVEQSDEEDEMEFPGYNNDNMQTINHSNMGANQYYNNTNYDNQMHSNSTMHDQQIANYPYSRNSKASGDHIHENSSYCNNTNNRMPSYQHHNSLNRGYENENIQHNLEPQTQPKPQAHKSMYLDQYVSQNLKSAQKGRNFLANDSSQDSMDDGANQEQYTSHSVPDFQSLHYKGQNNEDIQDSLPDLTGPRRNVQGCVRSVSLKSTCEKDEEDYQDRLRYTPVCITGPAARIPGLVPNKKSPRNAGRGRQQLIHGQQPRGQQYHQPGGQPSYQGQRPSYGLSPANNQTGLQNVLQQDSPSIPNKPRFGRPLTANTFGDQPSSMRASSIPSRLPKSNTIVQNQPSHLQAQARSFTLNQQEGNTFRQQASGKAPRLALQPGPSNVSSNKNMTANKNIAGNKIPNRGQVLNRRLNNNMNIIKNNGEDTPSPEIIDDHFESGNVGGLTQYYNQQSAKSMKELSAINVNGASIINRANANSHNMNRGDSSFGPLNRNSLIQADRVSVIGNNNYQGPKVNTTYCNKSNFQNQRVQGDHEDCSQESDMNFDLDSSLMNSGSTLSSEELGVGQGQTTAPDRQVQLNPGVNSQRGNHFQHNIQLNNQSVGNKENINPSIIVEKVNPDNEEFYEDIDFEDDPWNNRSHSDQSSCHVGEKHVTGTKTAQFTEDQEPSTLSQDSQDTQEIAPGGMSQFFAKPSSSNEEIEQECDTFEGIF